MIIVDKSLRERGERNDPIKVGLVGIGEMGKGLLNQIHHYLTGIQVVFIYSRISEKARLACSSIGILEYYQANSDHYSIEEAIEAKKPIITSDINLLIESELVDVIAEMTGDIQFGLKTILESFKNGKSVVSFNAELEATFGPFIKDQAEFYKVKYSLGDGDQPGVTMNLWRYVKMIGFKPLLCGNIKSLQDRYRNPTTQEEFAKKWNQDPKAVTSYADGTKLSFEQACIANATNMTISETGMIGMQSNEHVDDLTKCFDVEKLENQGGIVDYILGAKPAPGVFIYASNPDGLSQRYMKYAKMGDGPLYSFYIPYHLLYFEFASSIVRLVDFSDVTLDARFGYKVEVIAVAKRDIKVGDTLDGIGGYKVYGICENSEKVKLDGLLPMGLSEGVVVRRNIKKDSIINLDDIESFPEGNMLNLYTELV